jgi:glycosyltransferase involved in cell wall biosynthesis
MNGAQLLVASKVCLAIPTFRRPDLLGNLLARLGRQTFATDRPNLQVFVLDNDPEQTARRVVDAYALRFPWPLRYAPVIEPGLSAVRNYALALASPHFEFLIMIDDDEEPVERWLAELLRVQAMTAADAVLGPVVRRLAPGSPQWVADGNFFPYLGAGLPDGELLNDGYTGNSLLRVRSIEAFGLSFDRALNSAGGEDQLFFRQLLSRGGRITFAARAVATEHIPVERTTMRYLFQNAFSKGNRLAFCDLKIRPTLRTITIRLGKGVCLTLNGIAACVFWTLLRRTTPAVEALCLAARGLGMVSGLLGLRNNIYARRAVERLPSAT